MAYHYGDGGDGVAPEQDFISKMEREGYDPVRAFVPPHPSGADRILYCGVLKMIFTGRLCVGLDRTGWECCYDYHTVEEAIVALSCWDGNGDPPGMWIKMKGAGPERLGPGASGWRKRLRDMADKP